MKKHGAIVLAFAAILFFSCGLHQKSASAQTGDPEGKQNAESLFEQGVSSFLSRSYEDAVDTWTQAIELDPSQSKIYYNRGIARLMLEDHDKAIADFTRALEIQPNYAKAYYSRGFVWKTKSDYDRAIRDYIEALSIDPNVSEAYYELAWIYAVAPEAKYRNGNQAVIWAKKARGSNDSLATIDLLAAAYAEAGDFEKAVETQKEVVAGLKRDGKTESLADAEARLKRFAEGKSLRAPSDMDQGKDDRDIAEQDIPAKETAETGSTVADSTPDEPATVRYVGRPHPYTIQVSAYRTDEKSKKVALKLIHQGNSAFTARTLVSGKGTWYRVFVGSFMKLSDAWKAAALLKKEGFAQARIKKMLWAVSLGDFAVDQLLFKKEQALLTKNIVPYRMASESGGATRLLVGAYRTEKEAQTMNKEIEMHGFAANVVQR